MARNVDVNNQVIAADEAIISGVLSKLQEVGVRHGVEGAEGARASTTNPFPVVTLAGTSVIGQIIAAMQTGIIYEGTESRTVKRLPLALTGSADVVAMVALKAIRVVALVGLGTTSGTIKFQSGASTDKTGAMRVLDGTPLVMPFNQHGWFQTAVGEKLNAVLATMTAFNGTMLYIETDA